MVFEELSIKGVFKITCDDFLDTRGSVTKVFTENGFAEHGLTTNFKESFFSISAKNVIRGMHFQVTPSACSKLVYVPVGAILDVILDIRKDEPTFGKFVTLELSRKNHTAVFIPEGFAHGFISLEDNSYTTYLQSHMRDTDAERGVRYDSFGMEWGLKDTILSERDTLLPTLEEYRSTLAI